MKQFCGQLCLGVVLCFCLFFFFIESQKKIIFASKKRNLEKKLNSKGTVVNAYVTPKSGAPRVKSGTEVYSAKREMLYCTGSIPTCLTKYATIKPQYTINLCRCTLNRHRNYSGTQYKNQKLC